MGKVNYGNSIVNYFGLLAALGMTTYAVRECAKVRDDKDKLSLLSSQLISINLCTTILSYCLLGLLLLFGTIFDNYRLLIVIQSTTILFTTLGADWINTALEDFKFITLRTFVFQIISLILMFLFVRSPNDYMIYAGIVVLSSSGGNICNIIYRKKYCKIKMTLKMELRRHMLPIITMFAMYLSQSIFTNLDITMLGFLRGDTEVGLYSTSMRIYNVANSLVSSIIYVVMPRVSNDYKLPDYEKINQTLKYTLNYIFILGFPIITGIYMMAEEIVTIIGGNEYSQAAASLRILSIALGFSFLNGFFGSIIYVSSGREKKVLLASVIAASMNAAANVILIPFFGLNAAAATTVLAEMVSLIIYIKGIEKEIHIQRIDKMLRCPLIGSIWIAFLCVVSKGYIESLWIRMILCVLASVLIYVIVLAMGKDEFAKNIFISIKRRSGRRE